MPPPVGINDPQALTTREEIYKQLQSQIADQDDQVILKQPWVEGKRMW